MTTIEKIRAEIEEKYGNCDICEYFEDYDYEENDISEYRPIGNIADVLQIIDKYAEQEKYCQECVKADNCNEYGTINCKWRVVKNDL